MPTVVGVTLRYASKVLWFDPSGIDVSLGDRVVVDTERGQELGTIAQEAHEVSATDLPAALKLVVRIATEEDLAADVRSREREREAMVAYRDLVKKYRLDMKPVGVESAFAGDRMTFYFAAEERVDFRDLVRDLANTFRARIDMRQIGVRDEARMVGGIAHCGQPLCCTRFGGEFSPVSIRMAKEQDLPLNPLKISGLCGRLMCCLRYEYEAYRDYKSRAPKRGAIIDSPRGPMKVVDLDTPRERVTVLQEGGGRVSLKLADIGCSCDKGCPCSVSAEVLDRESAPTTGIAAALAKSEAELAAAPKPEAEKSPKPAGRGSRRGSGRRKSSQEQSSEAPRQVTAAPPAAAPAAGAAPAPTGTSGRRRRRRRRPGGSEGGE